MTHSFYRQTSWHLQINFWYKFLACLFQTLDGQKIGKRFTAKRRESIPLLTIENPVEKGNTLSRLNIQQLRPRNGQLTEVVMVRNRTKGELSKKRGKLREISSENNLRNDSIYIIFEGEREPLEMDANLSTIARYR